MGHDITYNEINMIMPSTDGDKDRLCKLIGK